MSQKQVMPKSEDLSRSLEINAIWTFDTEFTTIFNKSCTYITFKSAVKHRQLGYGTQCICLCPRLSQVNNDLSVFGLLHLVHISLFGKSSRLDYHTLIELEEHVSL